MVRVAALQLSSQADVSENLRGVRGLLDRAAADGASVALLPEGFAFLGSEVDKARHAETFGAGGPIQDFLQETAARLDLTLIAGGMPERSDVPERPYNTSVVIGPDGSVLERYRKVHLFDVELSDGTKLTESAGNSAGDVPRTVELSGLIFGLSICYDLRFPELFAAERQAGAHVLTVPAAFTATTGRAHWHVLLRARAIETQCYVVAPAQWGSHPRDRHTFGHTLIVDPWGEIVAEWGEGVGLATAEISLERIESVRAQMPIAAHRRLV